MMGGQKMPLAMIRGHVLRQRNKVCMLWTVNIEFVDKDGSKESSRCAPESETLTGAVKDVQMPSSPSIVADTESREVPYRFSAVEVSNAQELGEHETSFVSWSTGSAAIETACSVSLGMGLKTRKSGLSPEFALPTLG
jgi:hypothetical protein